MEQQYLIKNVDTCLYFCISDFRPDTKVEDLNFGAMGNATPSNKKAAHDLITVLHQYDKALNLEMEELDDELASAMLKDTDIVDFIKRDKVNKYMSLLEGKYREEIYSLYMAFDKANISHDAKLIPDKIIDLLSDGVMNIPNNEEKGISVMILLFDSKKDDSKYIDIYSMLLDMGIESQLKRCNI